MQQLILAFRLTTVLLLMSASPRLAWANTAPVLAEAPPGAPKSVFNSQPGSGKDPFFPNSTRLRPRVSVRPDTASLSVGVPDLIVLKGLAVLNQRKLAIINNYTVEAGEEFNLKIGGHTLKVKCVEIKENSVSVSVNGSTKELQLRPGL